MKDEDRDKADLIKELAALRQQVAALKKTESRSHRSSEAWRDLWAQYEAMIEAFDGHIYICSENYEVEFMNQRFIERTGSYPLGQKCYRVLHDQSNVCPWCVNDRVFRGETVRWEVQSPKDHHWYYVVNTPIRHPDGSMSKMAMIQDVTAHKLTEQALQEAEAKYRGIYENAVIGIFQSTPDGAPAQRQPGPGPHARLRCPGGDGRRHCRHGPPDLCGPGATVCIPARTGRVRGHPGPGVPGVPPGRHHLLGGGQRPGGAGRNRRHQLLRGVYPGHHGTENRPGMLTTDLIVTVKTWPSTLPIKHTIIGP